MDNKLLDSTNDVEFNLATADIKGRRFNEAVVKFETLVRTKNSPQAWCGLALSKLGLLISAEVTVDEVFFCFETAKKLDSSGAGEIESLIADTTFGAMTEMYAVKAFSRQVKDEAHKKMITGLFTTVAGGVLGARKGASLYSTITGVGASAFGATMINDGAETKSAARLTEAKVQSILCELENSSKKFLAGNQQLLEDFTNRVESLHQAIRQLEAREEAEKLENRGVLATGISDFKTTFQANQMRQKEKYKLMANEKNILKKLEILFSEPISLLKKLFSKIGSTPKKTEVDSGAAQSHQSSKNVAAKKQQKGSNKVTVGILAIVLGALGVHKFILGYTKDGLIMLLVTVLTLGLGGLIMAPIGLIEGIIYLTKSDEDFIATYVTNKRAWF